jgi:hypothetical protein
VSMADRQVGRILADDESRVAVQGESGRTAVILYAGTSGYSYKAWKGRFFPEDLPDRQMLPYYSERVRAVEP